MHSHWKLQYSQLNEEQYWWSLHNFRFQVSLIWLECCNHYPATHLSWLGTFWYGADHLQWEVLGIWLQYYLWATKISILNIRHKYFLTKPYAQSLKMIVFETDWRAVLNPIQFQILSLIASGQNIVISVLLTRVGSFWCGADHLEWEAIGAWLLYSGWPTKILILNIRQYHIQTFSYED